ncbi:hypothetical protein PIB30_097782 [Stylosanthes scabra]|uniref:Putative plant transposon protein domain-containing protein n=1 Tax=Stylosanthes scabra TaxID=79078 RepID=A0ABU6ZVR5_9FABA|nr:hypothetical protein [Stylosanthes scabra]
MAALLRKKKGKAPATSSSEAPLFKTLYHEAHYKKFFITRKVFPEAKTEVDDDSLAPMAIQIKTRKWQKVTTPNLNVGYSLVREFYANAWRTDADKKKANNDLRLEEVLAYLCEEGAQWVVHRDGSPHFLRRADLQPMARGWYEFVCRSIIATTSRSEVTMERAVLIHSIIIGEDILVEEIIADKIYKHVNKTNLRSKLPFPGLISLLCQEKKVSIPGDTLIPCESGINGKLMGCVRETREPREPRMLVT